MGAVALAFLVTGYQTALFVHRAATLSIVAGQDRPDTVYVIERVPQAGPPDTLPRRTVTRRQAPHRAEATAVRRQYTPRRYESFRFNPNTVSVEDMMRLGLSRKQAESIERYRSKGGRFARKEDFAKSYVVSDSLYVRLAPYIDIPPVDLNQADSAAFEALPGIGPWFAARMVAYRKELKGYSYKEQLMDIWHFDEEKYRGLEDLVTVGPCPGYPLWTLPEDSLRLHPYLDRHTAHAIILYRESTPPQEHTIQALLGARILGEGQAAKLARCRIAAE